MSLKKKKNFSHHLKLPSPVFCRGGERSYLHKASNPLPRSEREREREREIKREPGNLEPRERVQFRSQEREREREGEQFRGQERERKREQSTTVCVREREKEDCVCLRERERERMQGRSRVLVCLLLLVIMESRHGWCRRHDHHEKLSKVKRYLKRHNKPAVLTIQSPDGDTINCVPISKQPALDHPLLKDHKIQMEPSVYPTGHISPKEAAEGSNSERNMRQQLWHEVQEKCPSGTIPIRRTTEAALLRAKSIKSYGRKFHQAPSPVVRDGILNENAHQHAIAYVQGGNFYGAKATMNVWDPSIEVPNEFSLSQLWILAGSFDGNLNSIEAGWQVNPDLYGDNNTRLFTYWTSDAYQATGCYNLLCSGFIQVSDEIALGATISPVSNYDGVQYEINILVWKDPNDGNWWMQFGDKYVLGYWPDLLFSELSESSSMVEWGGEVVNSGVNGRHTATHMGSGHFPNEGFGKSSYIANIQVVDSHNNLRPPPSYLLNTYSEQPNCYRVQQGYNSEWGYYFFYGGPGFSSICT